LGLKIDIFYQLKHLVKSRLKFSGEVLTIGICGGSGSGKTTIINELRKTFTHDEVCLLSLDDYYVPRDQQVIDDNGIKNFDLPESINKKELVRDINKLINGEFVERVEYTFNNATAKPKTLCFLPAPIIIVEGIFIYHYVEVKELLDVKIFIEADHEIKLRRRIQRDSIERNYPESDVRYRFEHHVTPSYELYVAPYKSICDLVINNNVDYKHGLAILKTYLKSRLMEINQIGENNI